MYIIVEHKTAIEWIFLFLSFFIEDGDSISVADEGEFIKLGFRVAIIKLICFDFEYLTKTIFKRKTFLIRNT